MMANRRALVALVQMGVLELHPWGSAAQARRPTAWSSTSIPTTPLPWSDREGAALLVRGLLEELGLAPFLKTTGGKGLHVVVPIAARAVGRRQGFAKTVAELLVRTFPDRFTAKLSKVARTGKIFIDYLRNAEGATAVAAYSLRARANAPVATPVAW